ncbi:MAG: helix-turn-helix transcriptional regulator [Paracoccaceae bacterium]
MSNLVRIAEARYVEEVWVRLTEMLREFGFTRINYGLTCTRAGRSIGDPRDVLFLSTHALDRVRAHHESGLYLKTPEYRWVLENVGAVSWGWTAQERAAGRLTDEECAAMDAIAAERRCAGYSISFAEGNQRSKAAMGLAGGRQVSQDDLDAHWAVIGDAVLALCNMAHLRICALPLPVPGGTLTDRQRELLEWTADGKTIQDISVLTGLSVSAIEKHLRRARDFLGVETTAQAVAKAALLNQMFIGTEAELGLRQA